MATSKEKIALGLAETATDDEVFARIQQLVTPAPQPAVVEKIAMLSLVPGKERPRGSFFIPPPSDDPNEPGRRTQPLVVDKAMISPENLAEIKSDPYVMWLDSETPLTLETEIRRYTR